MNYTYYRRYQAPRRSRSHFKGFFWVILGLVAVAIGIQACVGIVNGVAEEKKDEAVLTVQKGGAEVRSFGQEDWQEAGDTQVFLEGDSVRTSDGGWVTLEFYNGMRMRLADETVVTFTEVLQEGEDEVMILDLKEGRVWLDRVHDGYDNGELSLRIRTDVIDMVALNGDSLITQTEKAESVYVFDGEVSVELLDRRDAEDPDVIERFYLKEGTKTEFFKEDKVALLERKDVVLYQEFNLDEFGQSDFLQWNLGDGVLPENDREDDEKEEESSEEEEEKPNEEEEAAETDEEEPLEEEAVLEEESEESLKITIYSPSSGSTIEKDAIAIEGGVLTGEAARVSVTWSGNGQAYDLGFFEPGSESFRYVADAAYGNFVVGQNTYTIVAYDAEGKPSNTVTVVLTGKF